MAQHTMLCGYCAQPFPAGSTCGCAESQRRHAARQREHLTRLEAQRQGVAQENKKTKPWKTLV